MKSKLVVFTILGAVIAAALAGFMLHNSEHANCFGILPGSADCANALSSMAFALAHIQMLSSIFLAVASSLGLIIFSIVVIFLKSVLPDRLRLRLIGFLINESIDVSTLSRRKHLRWLSILEKSDPHFLRAALA